jgi:hypothetical protein
LGSNLFPGMSCTNHRAFLKGTYFSVPLYVIPCNICPPRVGIGAEERVCSPDNSEKGQCDW